MAKLKVKTKEPFNKGIAAFQASLLTILSFILIRYIGSFFMGLICGIYAGKTKMIPTYYKKSGGWGYFVLIWLLAILGLPYFFYDVFKNKAIKDNQDVNTRQGGLFWSCVVFWVLSFALIFAGLILSFNFQ